MPVAAALGAGATFVAALARTLTGVPAAAEGGGRAPRTGRRRGHGTTADTTA
nr:hypothetical protein [Streptomyces sp. MA5143a]